MCANENVSGLNPTNTTGVSQPPVSELEKKKQQLRQLAPNLDNIDSMTEAEIEAQIQKLSNPNPNSVIADNGAQPPVNANASGSVFTTRKGSPKGPSITVTDNDNHEITFDNYTSDWRFSAYLGRKNFTDKEIAEILSEKDPEKLQAKLKEGLDAYSEKNKSGTLVLDKDRYAKLEPFKEEKHLEASHEKAMKEHFPQSEYPDLYNKKGELKLNKAWKEFENQTMFAGLSDGKSEKERIAEFVAQGMTEAEAKKNVKAQNESFLKQEKIVQNKIMNGDQLSDEEKRFVDARDGAHDVAKSAKKFSKNVEKVTDRINEAIDKMNKWDWNKDLNSTQREKIKAAVKSYGKDQEMPNLYNDMFDESGNLKNKNMLYQFVMDRVTGTDAQVNKSAKKGGFFSKIFKKKNEEYTEKAASRDLGLNKKDIENMGFAWEKQISVGKTLLDGAIPSVLGAAFGAAISDSKKATAKVDDQVINETKPYSGSVDYKVNGETVMKIPYDGTVSFFKEIAGDIATEKAKVSAVLPSALMAGIPATLHSLYTQGTKGQEKDIFRGHLLDTIATATSKTELKTPDDVLRACGMKDSKNNQQYQLAKEILSYYYDDKDTLHTTELEADWKYNAGYKSKYLNMEEGAMWLEQLRKKGKIKSNNNKVKVTIPPEVMRQIVYDIQGNGDLAPLVGTQVIRVDDYQAKGAEAEARDYKTMTRNGVATNITNAQQLANVNKNRAQYVVANAPTGEKVQVTPSLIEGVNDYNTPSVITMSDVTNGVKHTFTYKLVTDISGYPSLKNEQGPFYKLISAEDGQGNSILNKRAHDEIVQLDLVQNEPEIRNVQDEKGNPVDVEIRRNDYNLVQPNANFPGFGTSSVNNKLYKPFNPGRK